MVLAQQGGFNVDNVTIKQDANGNAYVTDLVVPVGTVMPWLKSLTGTPSLPATWAECDGSVVSDANSPYDGVTLPNLNGASAGTKRFLRGSATSGTTGGTETHTHAGTTSTPSATKIAADTVGDTYALSNHTHTFTTGTTATLPSYYEVVYIIKIK